MPTWKELRRFLEHNGWELYKDTDHYFYRKRSEDGSMLFTKVSKGSEEIGNNLWRRILHHELKVTQEYFSKKK